MACGLFLISIHTPVQPAHFHLSADAATTTCYHSPTHQVHALGISSHIGLLDGGYQTRLYTKSTRRNSEGLPAIIYARKHERSELKAPLPQSQAAGEGDQKVVSKLILSASPGEESNSPALEIRVQSLYLKKLGSLLIQTGDELFLLIEKNEDLSKLHNNKGEIQNSLQKVSDQAATTDVDMRGHAADEVAVAVPRDSLFLTSLQGSMEERREQLCRAYAGLLAMARPHNYVPAALLVLLGAWLACHKWQALIQPTVWLVGILSGLTALASMIANDVFDFRSGVDKVNGPSKPLVTGEVHPDDAELTAGCLYGAVVLGCCCLDSFPLRLLVGASAVATYLYTPFLKKITLVKNIVVAGIIASSIPAGGLAAGGIAGLQNTTAAVAFLFPAMVFREIVMDVSDVNGDSRVGVMTVPVRLGQRGGLRVALAVLAVANCLLVALAPGPPLSAMAASLPLVPLYSMTLDLLAVDEPQRDQLSKIVNQSMLMIGVCLFIVCLTS